MKKGTLVLVILVAIILIGLLVPVTVVPSDSRVILDHTYNVYSAPACYDQANLTNNLEESTLRFANELGYESESSCTDDEFQGERKPFLIGIFSN